MKVSDRMALLGTESAFEVLARAQAMEADGRKIIHLEIGEPDFPTPGHIELTGAISAHQVSDQRSAIQDHVSTS